LEVRFRSIAPSVGSLPVRSCIIDGEAIACDQSGLADFRLLRRSRRDQLVTLIAFDLLELDGRDLRGEPIEARKAELARVLAGGRPELVLDAVFDEPGPIVFQYGARWVAKASSRNVAGRGTSAAGQTIGSRSRTRTRRLYGGNSRRSGDDLESTPRILSPRGRCF
jgi:hypothetical protein